MVSSHLVTSALKKNYISTLLSNLVIAPARQRLLS